MSKESAIELLKNMWIQTKYKMKEDNYIYDTLEEASKHYDILERIHQIYSNDTFNNCRNYVLTSGISLTRVVEVEECDIERIIPKEEYRRLNRMNPEDRFYGYYVIDYCGQNRTERIKTGIKEKRAQNHNKVSSCEFSITGRKLNLAKFAPDPLLHLKLENETMIEDIYRIKTHCRIHGGKKGREEAIQIYTYNLMSQTMIAGEVFCPVDGNDDEKKFHYAPFHLIADYLERRGYDGILYQSSVDPEGYCVAIFEPSNVTAINDTLLCNINVQEVLNS